MPPGADPSQCRQAQIRVSAARRRSESVPPVADPSQCLQSQIRVSAARRRSESVPPVADPSLCRQSQIRVSAASRRSESVPPVADPSLSLHLCVHVWRALGAWAVHVPGPRLSLPPACRPSPAPANAARQQDSLQRLARPLPAASGAPQPQCRLSPGHAKPCDSLNLWPI